MRASISTTSEVFRKVLTADLSCSCPHTLHRASSPCLRRTNGLWGQCETSRCLLPSFFRRFSSRWWCSQAPWHIEGSTFWAAGSTTIASRPTCHVGNGKWLLDRDPAPVAIELGQPGDVFEHASMQGVEAADNDRDDAAARAVRVRRAAPHWPESYVRSLASCGISGQGMIAFDADFFLSQLTSTAMDHPLLFPHAAAKLELNGLRRCEELMAAAAVTLRCGRADVSSNAFAEVVQRAQRAQRSVAAMAAMARDGVGVAAQASDGVD
jgi:hypothetical protein